MTESPETGAPAPAKTGSAAARGGSDGPAPAISIRGLAKSYARGRPVLAGLDLTVETGERVALIGANGSGKSTLMKCLIGLTPLSAGRVEVLGHGFEGAPSAAARAALRQRTGFVFQNHSLVRRRTVLSNVCHGLMGGPGSWRSFSHVTAPAAWRDRAMGALAEVGLADRALDRADTLSGGQQQRVAIARALIRRPELLIADEPAASLDPKAGRDVMELFLRLCADRGITLLYSSHDMAHALDFSTRVIGLRDGRLTLDGPSADLAPEALSDMFERSEPDA